MASNLSLDSVTVLFKLFFFFCKSDVIQNSEILTDSFTDITILFFFFNNEKNGNEKLWTQWEVNLVNPQVVFLCVLCVVLCVKLDQNGMLVMPPGP